MIKTLLLVFALAAAAQLMFTACNTAESWVMLPNLSPPIAVVAGRPLDQGERVAKTVPGGFVLVAHGTVKFSIYPTGTVLVIQPIEWEHLRSGMTAIFYLDQELSAALTGGILVREEKGVWRVPGIEEWHAPGTGRHEELELVTKSRYVGVVVAAFLAAGDYDPSMMLRNAPSPVAGTCLLRCHVSDAPLLTGRSPPAQAAAQLGISR